MRKLKAKRFVKWVAKQDIPSGCSIEVLSKVGEGKHEFNLDGNIYKKRARFEERGKSGIGSTIVCY
ncbi:type II toxin-antitoxin system RelE/ParE family toxin [Desulfofustis limnaeus]|jgi:hypothetical protein|uniref:type II toxin-antitoxin system RelE/ParE family toxin n=1 Tax=Desulfofustis limnaeus TaxID=2740163 RepID=UPI00338FE746